MSPPTIAIGPIKPMRLSLPLSKYLTIFTLSWLILPHSMLANELSPLVVRPTMEPLVIGIKQSITTKKFTYFVPPDLSELPKNKYGEWVKYGRNIFVETQTYAARYVGNGLNCSNCHLGEGRQPHAAPLWAAYGMYPVFREKRNQVVTFEEQIQHCFHNHLNGMAPTQDAPEMLALISYSQWLSTGVPTNTTLPGRGFSLPSIAKIRDPDLSRGEDLYQVQCAMCHGSNGLGKKYPTRAGYMFPPLWGTDSYNRAAAFNKSETLAKFIRANMPLGTPYRLTMDQSLDIAAYIWIQYRPYSPRKSFFVNTFISPETGQN